MLFNSLVFLFGFLPVTYVVFSDEGHGFARPVNNMAMFAAGSSLRSSGIGAGRLRESAGLMAFFA